MNPKIPRATFCYLFGRNFQPGQEHFRPAFEALFGLHRKLLEVEYFDDYFGQVPINQQEMFASDRIIFTKGVEDIVRKEYPNAYTLSALFLDQRTGNDLALYAIWDGISAIAAKNCFQKPWWKFW